MEATAAAYHSNPSSVSETSDETSILNEYTGEKKMISTEGHGDGGEQKEGKAYSCNWCKREFDSFRALGGHQNGHKRERSAAKAAKHRKVLSEKLALGYPHAQYSCNPYSSTAWLPSLKSCNGFFGHSPQYVIYKPYNVRRFMQYQSSSHGAPPTDHGAINPQPEAKRMRVDHDERGNIVSNNGQTYLPAGGIGDEDEVQELDLSLKL